MAGIYVHVPFCKTKCAYCDFYSVAGEKFKQPYVVAVAAEWAARRCELGDHEISTIYFGGGTPSSLTPDDLAVIAGSFPLDRVEEFTLEVNPEDVNPALVSAWRKLGVNRVSMGVQSLIDDELKAVGRRHSAAEALSAIDCLHRNGIENISCDLIYGLPGQTLESWKESLYRLIASGITHLSAYSLSFEEGTRLTAWMKEGRVKPVDDEVACAMYDKLCRATADAGFVHYEISNFAFSGFESRHNSSYWDGCTPYLGLGPGAHSLDSVGVRRFVPAGLTRYISDPEHAAEIDEETEMDRLNDLLFVSLRTARGLDLGRLTELQREELSMRARRYARNGLVVETDTCMKIPERHWLMSDAVIRELLFEAD